MEITREKLNLIMAIASVSPNARQLLDSYEETLFDNSKNETVFLNMSKYQLTGDNQYLKFAKEIALENVSLDNFENYELTLEQIDILIEDIEYELKNNLHAIATPEEYQYYLALIARLEQYVSMHFSGIYKMYACIRCYKLSKLIWPIKNLVVQYDRVEELYRSIKKYNFDYYLYKLSLDLINMADYQNRFEKQKTKDWKSLEKKYEQENKTLTILLDMHPKFSTKAAVLWLYYISPEAGRLQAEEICNRYELDLQCDSYEELCSKAIAKCKEMLPELQSDSDLLSKYIACLLEIRNIALNHYDLTYMPELLAVYSKYEYSLNKIKQNSNTDKKYEEWRKIIGDIKKLMTYPVG